MYKYSKDAKKENMRQEDSLFISQMIEKRKILGMTQVQFCELCGISNSSILSRWEAYSSVPSIKSIQNICKATGLEYNFLSRKNVAEEKREATERKKEMKRAKNRANTPIKQKKQKKQKEIKPDSINLNRDKAVALKGKIKPSQRMHLVIPLDGSKPFTTNKPEKYPSKFYKVSK